MTRNWFEQEAALAVRMVFVSGLLLAWSGAVLGQDTITAEAMFRKLDKSGDGVLTMDEATVGTRSYLDRLFKAAGKQSGDRVTREEFTAAQEQLRNKPALAAAKTPPVSQSAPADGQTPPEGIGYIDANGDGTLSRAEWLKFTQTFGSLDADKDGSLSSTELQATGGSADLIMKIADANGDGKVARIEWAKLAQSFVRLDANRDKSLDLAELEKAADAAVASASGSASLPGGSSQSGAKSVPTLWRGQIEGRGQIELLVDGNHVIGREFGNGGGGAGLGAGTITMSGNGKLGNMDAVYTEGDRAGQVCLGIYRLEGNKLMWCVNNRGGRPEDFSSGHGDWLLTLTRVDDPANKTPR